MKYRVDLVAHGSVVVEAPDEDTAIEKAETFANDSFKFRPEFEWEDGGIEETDDDVNID